MYICKSYNNPIGNITLLYNDIIYRDIVVRHKLPSDRQIREVAYYLASNYTHRFTYNSVAKATGIKSADTVTDYIGYLEESYLVGVVTKYDYKVGEQMKSPKKVYFVDNGLVSQIGFNFSNNFGQKLENAVYVELRRREKEIFYFHDKGECDFVIREGIDIVAAYQVTVSLKDEETRKREVDGLKAAMDAFGLREGYIITKDETEEQKLADGRVVHVVPFYRWIIVGMPVARPFVNSCALGSVIVSLSSTNDVGVKMNVASQFIGWPHSFDA